MKPPSPANDLAAALFNRLTAVFPRESLAARYGRCIELARRHPMAVRRLLAALREMSKPS